MAFIRTRLTWLAYFMLASVAFTQSMLGPIMPVLRNELAINYTAGGLLSAATAIGLILSGLSGDRLAHQWGRKAVFWVGAVILAFGGFLISVSRFFELAFLASLTIGFGSSLAQVMIQALLSEQHGEGRATAIAESNVGASLSATLTPILVGGLQSLGLGWRLVPMIPFFMVSFLAAVFHRQPIPDSGPISVSPNRDSLDGKDPNKHLPGKNLPGRRHTNDPLPRRYWIFWLVLLMVVSTEMSLAVWAADFLANVAGLGQANAALAFGSFSAAMLVGRFAGSRLTRRWSSELILTASLCLALAGFPIFWLSPLPALNILGLFITGLGVANLFPLTLSIAIGLAGDQTNQASARASLGVGSALLIAPLFLGWLADRIGLQNAFGTGIFFLLAALGIVLTRRYP